jgi:hypothetical protein
MNIFRCALTMLLVAFTSQLHAADTAKIVLVAGKPSHGPGDHEFNAGCKLLAKCLAEVPGAEPVVVTGGWPEDEHVFDNARAIIFFMDGGSGHPIIQGDHLHKIQALIDKGVGLGCLHYAVEVPKGARAIGSSNGSAATTKVATPRTPTGSRTSRACPPTPSRAESRPSP